ncbi:MAG: bacterial Ig-like domain-containing protein [Oscillospiraceae bacterium]|nr:bacterial Ig-like domain-containing protein [Oscillospiraceae bacterium]
MKKRWIGIALAAVLALVMLIPMLPAAKAASQMTVSADLVRVLKAMEGFSSKPYWDYGQWTVGYGTECPADKLEEYKANGIPEAEAQALLEKELDRFETAVNGFIDKHKLSLKQHQFDALVSFSYNCGEAWMYDLDGYFNTAVRENGSPAELIYGICLYSTAGGEYILAERRLCEANMYLYGQYRAYNKEGNPDNLRYVFLDGNGADTRYVIYGYDTNLSSDINVAYKSLPTGVSEQGQHYVCALVGWYTESGVKVDTLDGSLEKGQVLYARWKNHRGKVLSLPKGTVVNMTVTINADSMNVRKGPGTYYAKVGTYTKNTQVPITEAYEVGGYTWGKSTLGWFRLDYTNYAELKAAQSTFPKNGVVTGDEVNVRTGPGTDYSRVTQKNKGDAVVITEEAKGGSYMWGKMTDGNWICLDYVRYVDKVLNLTGIMMGKYPTKTTYKQNTEKLRLDGCWVIAMYDDGSTTAFSPTNSMVTSFSNANLGQTTVTLTYEGKTTTFPVTIVKPTVTFLNWDETVLSAAQYACGETVAVPEVPQRPSDGVYYYRFAGWDKPVTACQGETVYIAVFETTGTLGDADGDGALTSADAGLILQKIAGWDVEIDEYLVDVDNDGIVTSADAGLILQKIAGWDVTFVPKE